MDNACCYAGPDGVVRIGVRTDGSRISLTVEDSGPGIAGAERPGLFEPAGLEYLHRRERRVPELALDALAATPGRKVIDLPADKTGCRSRLPSRCVRSWACADTVICPSARKRREHEWRGET